MGRLWLQRALHHLRHRATTPPTISAPSESYPQQNVVLLMSPMLGVPPAPGLQLQAAHVRGPCRAITDPPPDLAFSGWSGVQKHPLSLSLLTLLLPTLTTRLLVVPSPFLATLRLFHSRSHPSLIFFQLTPLPSSSIFSRLFASKKPAKKDPQAAEDDAAPRSPVSLRSPVSPTTLSSLPPQSPNTPRSFRPGIGQPPVFQRPKEIGTAGSGIVLPRRKDGRDLWTVNDNPLSEEPGANELLKSQILVTGWLDAGAAGAEAADGEANRRSEEEDQSEEQSKLEVNATPEPEPTPSKLVLHIDTDANKSLSAPVPTLVVNHVGADDDKEGKVPALDPPLSSTTAGSPSITITHPSGEVKSLSEKEKDASPPHIGTLLSTIKEPDATAEDATAEEEDRDKVGGDLPSLSPLPETKRRHRSILGMGMIRLGSRRFRPLTRATTSATATTTTTTTTKGPERRRSLGTFIRRRAPSPLPTPTPSPTKATRASVEEKMVQPTIHTPASLITHIEQIEDDEERQRAETFYG